MRFQGSLQDVRMFVAAYEERSFTLAAEREHATQSGVSHHIRQLEARLQVQLFVRERLGVTPTPAADRFYAGCITTLRQIDGAAQSVTPFVEGYQGRFTVGMLPAITCRLAVPIVLKFTEAHPNVKVRLVESQGRLTNMLLSEQIDFAIGSLGPAHTGIRQRPIMTALECLVSRGEGSEAQVVPLPDKPIKMVSPAMQGGRYAEIRDWLRARRIEIETEFELRSSLAGLDMVRRDAEWMLAAPCISLDPNFDVLNVTPLTRPDVNFSVALIERDSAPLPPEAEAFVEVLEVEARAANNVWMEKFAAAGLL